MDCMEGLFVKLISVWYFMYYLVEFVAHSYPVKISHIREIQKCCPKTYDRAITRDNNEIISKDNKMISKAEASYNNSVCNKDIRSNEKNKVMPYNQSIHWR